jgi:hypothetical protein
MKHALLAVALVTAVLAPARSSTAGEPSNLDGKHLIGRLYSEAVESAGPKADSWEGLSYRTIELPINNYAVHLKHTDPNTKSVLVITCQDQIDREVAKAWGNVIWARRPGASYDFRHHRNEPYNKDIWWTFTDAFGNALANAEIKVFLKGTELGKPQVFTAIVDKAGRVQIPALVSSFDRVEVRLKEPQLGTFVLANTPMDATTTFAAPIARPGPQADARLVWGMVVDDANRPIAEARVCCTRILCPGGAQIGFIIVGWNNWSALTGPDGRFVLCVQETHFDELPAEPIAGLKYHICVVPPKALGFGGRHFDLPLGQGHMLELGKPELYRRTFLFEDANGPITDPARLDKIHLKIETPDGRARRYGYRYVKDGNMFALGKFKAWIDQADGYLFFETIDVAADSPRKLVFRPQSQRRTVFTGRVVEGFSEVGVRGALVALTGLGDNERHTIAMLSEAQWHALHKLGALPSLDEAALGPLHKIWHIEDVRRTDRKGEFEFSIPGFGWRDSGYRICAIEQGYMPVYLRLHHFDKDPNELIQLPLSRLLPAGKVAVTVAYGDDKYESAHMSWDLDQQHGPWFDEFVKYKSIKSVWFPLHKSICSGPHPFVVHVPAGISLRLSFQTRRNRQLYSPVYTEPIKVQPGEFVDLASIDLRETIPVWVQVVDQAGIALAGVGVKHCRIEQDHYRYFRQTTITDEQGMAQFLVPLNYKANFAVSCTGQHSQMETEHVAYETTGLQDANTVYTLRISDELLGRPFK